MSKPILASFFIWNGLCFYNPYALDHPLLWELVLRHPTFRAVPLDLKIALGDYPYSSHRGRVTFFEDRWRLFGTLDCSKHESALIKRFHLPVRGLWLGFGNDSHYKVSDSRILEEAIPYIKPRSSSTLTFIELA